MCVKPPADLIVVGSAAVDITAQADASTDPSLAKNSTAPGKVSLSVGGVARNMAEAAHRILTAQGLPASSLLVAPVGEDGLGRLLVDETEKLGMRTDGLLKGDRDTAVCDMVLDSAGNLVGGVADMEITQTLVDEQVHIFLSSVMTTALTTDRLYHNCESIYPKSWLLTVIYLQQPSREWSTIATSTVSKVRQIFHPGGPILTVLTVFLYVYP